MIYAMICDGVVINTVVLDARNAGAFDGAVPIGDVAAGIGDTYVDGAFWRDGVRLLTPLEAAQDTIAALDAALVELELTNAMMALGM